MEHPDIPEILASCRAKGAEIDVDDVTYYVGSVTIVPAKDGRVFHTGRRPCSPRWSATPPG